MLLFRWAVIALSCLAAATAFAQRSTPIQLLHPAGAASDQFGNAVAIDGDTMIVGAPLDNVGATADQGSAHVYRWTGSGWAFEATLTATGGAVSDQFGVSVALSGDTAIVGAWFDNVGANADQGSAYVFTRSGTTWTQQAQLTASDGAVADLFGRSVAMSGDTALVGAYLDDVGASVNQGSAYVFTRSGSTWTQQAPLTATGGAAGDEFGISVALSGDTAVVGSHLEDVGANANQGSAYVFTRSGTTWTQQAHLTATDGAAGDYFGYSAAISGDNVIVGAQLDNVGANADQGSAFVFTRSGTTWTQQAQLTAAGGAAGDEFGFSVALSGDSAIVGAKFDDVHANADRGSAFVFTRSGTTWTQQAQITATDGATGDELGFTVALFGDTAIVGAYADDVGANADQGSAWVFSRIGSTWIGPDLQALASDGAGGDQLGLSVAVDGDTAIAGAPGDDLGGNAGQGSAYIFVRAPGGTTWTQQAQITATGGAAADFFGFSVAISGNTALVGAYGYDSANLDQGSAYVFTRTGTTWTQQFQLSATGGAASDNFGYSVALSGDTAVVGAYLDNVGANNDQGSAYVFTRSGTTWTQQAQLTAAGGATGDNFGSSVAISNNTAIVGASRDDVGANLNQGSAYIFTRTGTTWTQQAQLTATGGAPSDLFGASVALSGDTAIVGANGDDVGANADQGSAYVFTRSDTTWTQQTQLTASGAMEFEEFGYSVSLSGHIAIIGAWRDNVGGNVDQGSAYVFTRAAGSTTWTQQAKITAMEGATSDLFGSSVAISGDTAVVGAYLDDVGANPDQGSAWFFDVPANDFAFARNDVTNVTYPTLAAALLPSQSGQQITATQAAWRGSSSLDSAGRSLILWSSGDLRTPSTTALTLGGSSSLNVPLDNVAEIFGQFRVSSGASADVSASAFLLGSRGIMTARTNSSLSINAPTSNLQGQTRVEQGAALTFSGSASAIGSTTLASNSTLTAGGTFENIDTLSITEATVAAPLLFNRAAFNVFGGCAIFGSFTNNAGAITTIRGETLFVFGTLTNNGTIIGTICASCRNGDPDLDVTGSLSIGPAASLLLPFANSVVRVGGNADFAINSNTCYDMSVATLQLEGSGVEQTLEVMSANIGADVLGLDRTLAGHYPIGTLRIGPSPSTVRLVDTHDNDAQGQASCEALYVRTLVIDRGSRLIIPSCTIYYETLVNKGVVDFPANLIQIGACPCPADFDNSGGTPDGTDIDAFFIAWLNGDAPADADCSGGTPDGTDVDSFFTAWLNGGC